MKTQEGKITVKSFFRCACLLLTAVLLFCLTACGEQIENKPDTTQASTQEKPAQTEAALEPSGLAAFNRYATFFDHSVLEWYLTQHYGSEAPSRYFYYDYVEGEVNILLARRTDDSELPEYVLEMWGGTGLQSWFKGEHELLEPGNRESVGYTPEDRVIEKIDFYGTDDIYSFYFVCDEQGRLEKFYLWDTLQEYSYDRLGRIAEARFDDMISYNDAFLGENDEFETRTYLYGDDGKLTEMTVASMYEDELEHYTFSYDAAGERCGIVSDSVQMTLKRDAAGKVISDEYYEKTSSGTWRMYLRVEYLPGGKCSFVAESNERVP